MQHYNKDTNNYNGEVLPIFYEQKYVDREQII